MGKQSSKGRDGEPPMDLETFLTVAQANALGGSYSSQLLQQTGGVTYAMLNTPQAQAILQQQHAAAVAAVANQQDDEPRTGKRSPEVDPGQGRASKRGGGRGAEAVQAGGDSNDTGQTSNRTQLLQEKNRRAQRRFRERQKAKVSELLVEVEELSTRVESLQADKQSLTHHSNILQKVLGMKEEQVETMTQRLKALDGQDASAPECETLEIVDSDGVAISVAKTAMQDKLSKVWREYVNKLAGCLVEGGANNPGAEIIDTINKLVRDAVSMYKKAALYDPGAMRKWFLSNMEDPGTQQQDSDIQIKWKSIVRSLALTGQQKEEITELKKMRAERLKELEKEACGLARKMAESAVVSSELPDDATGRMLSQQYIRHSDVVAKLRDNVAERSNAQLEFDSTLFQGIFTSLQMARVMVQSYPLVPDSVALVNWACQ